jgi:hypothetical protein
MTLKTTIQEAIDSLEYAIKTATINGLAEMELHKLIPVKNNLKAELERLEGGESDLHKALKLMWFFLPEHEPCNPHSNKATDKERNKRWHSACDLYQKHATAIMGKDDE